MFFYLDTIWNRLLKNSHSKQTQIFEKNYHKHHFRYLDELEKSQRLVDNWDLCSNPWCLLDKALSEKLLPPIFFNYRRRETTRKLVSLGLGSGWGVGRLLWESEIAILPTCGFGVPTNTISMAQWILAEAQMGDKCKSNLFWRSPPLTLGGGFR